MLIRHLDIAGVVGHILLKIILLVYTTPLKTIQNLPIPMAVHRVSKNTAIFIHVDIETSLHDLSVRTDRITRVRTPGPWFVGCHDFCLDPYYIFASTVAPLSQQPLASLLTSDSFIE